MANVDVLGMFSSQMHIQMTAAAYSQIGESCSGCGCASQKFFEALAQGSVAPDFAVGSPLITGGLDPLLANAYSNYQLFDEEYLPSRISRGLGNAFSTVGGWLVPDDIQNWWQNVSIEGTAIKFFNGKFDYASSLYDTHYGYKSWEHAMSTSGQSAQSVHQKLVDGSLGRIMEYRRAVEAGDCVRAGFALGQALHYLQDSYSESHTRRTASGIDRFQNYSLQSATYHAIADSPSAGSTMFGTAAGATASFICMASNMELSESQLRNKLSNVFFELAPGAIADTTLPFYRKR